MEKLSFWEKEFDFKGKTNSHASKKGINVSNVLLKALWPHFVGSLVYWQRVALWAWRRWRCSAPSKWACTTFRLSKRQTSRCTSKAQNRKSVEQIKTLQFPFQTHVPLASVSRFLRWDPRWQTCGATKCERCSQMERAQWTSECTA